MLKVHLPNCLKPSFYCSLTNMEVDCRISQPFSNFICHIDDLDVSDRITVPSVSLGPWHSPLASRVL